MALYQIVRTVDKKVVYPSQKGLDNGSHTHPNNQDDAKIIVAKLRAQDRKKGVDPLPDYVVQRIRDADNGDGSANKASGSTSIRIDETHRRMLAKIVGRHMMETGDQISMSEAVAEIINENVRLRALLDDAGIEYDVQVEDA